VVSEDFGATELQITSQKPIYGPHSWCKDDGQYADHLQFFRIIAENNLVGYLITREK
jgi:hypothetical protein